MTTPTPPAPAITQSSHPDRHYEPLTRALPAWLGNASASKRSALKNATPLPLPATDAAQQATLRQLNGAHWHAQNRVDQALKDLQDARTYSIPLLKDALKRQSGLELDVETTFIRLYIPQTIPWFTARSGGARAWTVSLLDAALHNFEHKETLADAYEPDSTYITQPDANGQFDTLPAIKRRLPIAAFAQLCRDLDLGARYMGYLRGQLGVDHPVAGAVLQAKVDASQKAALRAAVQLARIRRDIQEDYARLIEGLIDGLSGMRLGSSAVHIHDFSMMEAPLTGILLFAPDLENTRTVQRMVAYVPDDPEHPLKEYPSPLAFKQELTRQLRAADYQVFFSRFVAHEHRGAFFADLGQRLEKITWHPSEYGSGLAPWRADPTDDPLLQFTASPILIAPWDYLYQSRLNQLLNDARTLAVSTATVDRNARWALWDSFVNVASSIVNAALLVVAPFIPGLGELMLAYMAYQLLDDVFEGIVDWAEGLDREAFAHLMNLLESAVQLGLFTAGGQIGVPELRKLMSPQTLAFIDRFKPVTLASGARRYWKPDLAPYAQNLQLPPNLGIDELGLHTVRRESILPLEGSFYAVQKSPGDGQYRLKHPSRADAYQPLLIHNQAGTWRTELDQPLQWQGPDLLGRLGHRAQGLSDADRQLAMTLSGTDEAILRKMHHNSEPLPPLLDDALARLRIERELDTLIERLSSDDPALYNRIAAQDLLQLLTANGAWPHTRGLRFLDDQGRVVWTFGDQTKPLVQIHEAQLSNGDLLKTVLQTLTPEEIRARFGERASDPQLSLETRTRNLRKTLAGIARKHRVALFDSRYGPLQHAEHPQARQLADEAPGLPATVAERLLGQATGEELLELHTQRTPPRLAQLAQAALTEVRLNRAYEGQHLDSQVNLDTDLLALSALRVLPGWSTEINLQALHQSIDGEAWHSVGSDDAPIRRSLVRLDSGRYVAYDEKGPLCGETDLYSAILHALPDAQREQLNIDIHQGHELRERLRQRPPPRDEMRVLLGGDTPEPATETLQLLGHDAGYAHQPAIEGGPASLHQRARSLYPSLDDSQLHALIQDWQAHPGGAAAKLAQLAEEYAQLDSGLQAWQADVPHHHPVTGHALYRWELQLEKQNRTAMTQRLKAAWRRETVIDNYYEDPARDGHTLKLNGNILGEMPRLQANFDHVSLLSLNGSANLRGVSSFLGHFPKLRQLSVINTPLRGLPQEITSMPDLNALQLNTCQIVLTPQSQAQLAAMHQMRSLDLHGNPLGLVPSVETMPDLVALDLSRTNIDRLPAGVLSHPELQVALLSNNRISHLPDGIFQLAPESSLRFDLSRNPLNRETLERIKAYHQRHGTRFEASALQADRRDAKLLFPKFSEEQINRFIFNLPGDIEAGRRELARLAGDYQTLTDKLQAWAQAPALPELETARRAALKDLLERSWRRETPQQTQVGSLEIPATLAGELPQLSITFDHIGGLRIQGNQRPLHLDQFLRSFPNVHALSIQDAPLGDLPASLLSLQHLEFLSLPGCSIMLSASSAQGLEGMKGLTFLDLNHNPLAHTPDFSQLPSLRRVLLRNTGLREVPAGLLRSDQHVTVDLSNNAIENLPPAAFTLPNTAVRGIDLSGNPLSKPTLEQVKTYCQRTGEFFKAEANPGERERIQQLYPTFVDSEIHRFIFKLPGDMDAVTNQISLLEEEYRQLGTDLNEWVLDVPTHHPILGTLMDEQARAEQQLIRQDFKTLLEQAWRFESIEDEESLEEEVTHSLILDTPILGALPQLRARFNHVSTFELIGDGITTQVDGTLGSFPQLETLTLNKCSLQTLPTSIFNMPKLSSLDLSECNIALSPQSARALEDLKDIEFIDLSNNPLGHAPDVSQLRQLSSLHLRNAQLHHVPEGVFQESSVLHTLDLSNNHIEQLPASLLEISYTLDSDSDLRGNPLSPHSLALLREYYRRTGFAFHVEAARQDAEGNPLIPPLGREEE